ncbi:hypothetical protein HPB51_000957 [Rhipicephalus microplus]|uniref:Thioredoxin domain-containing protein n=1 Tax=Rhipicephalus microplus TaxID=6941 RepID=A0A9J6DL94_RHIMP|nr:hypothetical protein HPB51_000957 [Rhipicephalus microplus]
MSSSSCGRCGVAFCKTVCPPVFSTLCRVLFIEYRVFLSKMPVKQVTDDARFQAELSNSGASLVIVDFTASWCGPCQRMAPVFESLSNKYTQAVFLKVDIDQCQDIAAAHGLPVDAEVEIACAVTLRLPPVCGISEAVLMTIVASGVDDEGPLLS